MFAYCTVLYLQAISALRMSVRLESVVKVYSGKEDGSFDGWCSKFELVAKLQKLDELQNVLPLFLGGSAFQIYDEMKEVDKKDFKKIKGALGKAFSLDSSSAYEQLKLTVLQEQDAADGYLADIRRLTKLVCGDTPPESLVRSAFLSGLPSTMRMQLVAMVAVDDTPMDQLCARVRSLRGVADDAPSCAVGAGEQRSRSKTLVCFNCGQPNHVAKDCRKQGRKHYGYPSKESTWPQRGTAARACYRCGSLKHLVAECPEAVPQAQAAGNYNGGPSSALGDSPQ